jgi:hypothetical protein
VVTASKMFLASVVVFISLSSSIAKVSEKESVLQECNDLFGPAVDSKQNLFNVNEFYVLSAKFDVGGKLVELAVQPRYFFDQSHPDWTEPEKFSFLSKSDYENLLVRPDRIRPKGRLLKGSSALSYVTNMTAHHTEIYEHAALVWGELVDLRRGENVPLQVRWVRLNFSGDAKHNVLRISVGR